jgi:hypothetical protein
VTASESAILKSTGEAIETRQPRLSSYIPILVNTLSLARPSIRVRPSSTKMATLLRASTLVRPVYLLARPLSMMVALHEEQLSMVMANTLEKQSYIRIPTVQMTEMVQRPSYMNERGRLTQVLLAIAMVTTSENLFGDKILIWRWRGLESRRPWYVANDSINIYLRRSYGWEPLALYDK